MQLDNICLFAGVNRGVGNSVDHRVWYVFSTAHATVQSVAIK